jgi:predicted HicB family RNase H-like nuclease
MDENNQQWQGMDETEFEKFKKKNKIGPIITLTITEPKETDQKKEVVEEQEVEEKRPVGRPKKKTVTKTIHFRVKKELKEEWKRKAKEAKKTLTTFIIDKVEAPPTPHLGILQSLAYLLEIISKGPYHGRELKQAVKQMREILNSFETLVKEQREILKTEQELIGKMICITCETPIKLAIKLGQTKCACGNSLFKLKSDF